MNDQDGRASKAEPSNKDHKLLDYTDTFGRQGNSRRFLTLAFSLLLSAMLIVGVLRTAPLSGVWEGLSHVHAGYFALAMFCIAVNLILRGWRWSLLFRPDYDVRWQAATGLAMLGLAINAVLPGRMGEVVRIGLAARKFEAGVVFTTATVVLERLFDGVTLLVFLGGSLLLLPQMKDNASADFMDFSVSGELLTRVTYGLALVCFFLVLGVLLLSIPVTSRIISSTLSVLPGVGGWLERISENILRSVYRMLSSLHRPRVLVVMGLYSVSIWLMMAIGNYLVSLSIDRIDLTFVQILVITSVTMAVSSVPSAPGAWGVFEAGGLLALAIMGVNVDQADAVAFVISLHLSHYIPVMACGAVSAVAGQISFRRVREAATSSEQQ